MNKAVLFWMGFVSALAISADAQEEKAVFSVTSDFNSKYVWRGHNLVDDWVWQPSIGLSKGAWSAGIWGNLDMTDENSQSGEFTEYDFYGSYTFSITEQLSLSFGYIYYRFPSAGSTQEVYSSLVWDTILSPSLTVYYDFDDINGTYITTGISHSIEKVMELTDSIPVGLDLSCNVGWGDSNYNEGYWLNGSSEAIRSSGWNDLFVTVGFPMPLGKWTLTPSLNYVTILDSDIRKGLVSDDRDLFFTGFSLSAEF
ncbi:MAG TPA: hypothetical protein PK052_04240 [Anaerohalosphaeraceae bacterium]|nr:hypothetical protein [Phycisphaerae bacterium]HOK94951.1 hypothetical protein [Anaerohalosphaeraceae bacterium]HOL31170.1 hypothetical protein [Anaerohalosphaeraceae bacterium]HOM75947.1 hypothetical protein [Anaerohalosphaeraceae bacterium]HPC63497.1 hypothetical protein [Anaerohalosphaeraceae bacterium]